MKYLSIFFALLAGCSTNTIRSGIVHDYVISAAAKACKPHGGLHYIAEYTVIGSDNKCKEEYRFRCQDYPVTTVASGAGWCGVSDIQYEETYKDK